jgi:prepilin peptidase CpaA
VGIAFSIPIFVVLIAVGITAVTDVWKFKVYNALTLPLLCSGLLYHAYTGGSAAWLGSILGALFGFGMLLGLYVLGGIGGGDVKLMAGVGAWLGMPLTVNVFFASSLATGFYALFLIVAHHRTAETWLNLKLLWYRISAFGRYLGAENRVETIACRTDRATRLVPFGAMVAIGLLAAIAWSRFRGDF